MRAALRLTSEMECAQHIGAASVIVTVLYGGVCVAIQSGAQAMPPRFPALASKDLNGRKLSLPQDMPGERTIVIVAFEREQQANVDTWTSGLHLAGSTQPWLELPVIEDLIAPVRYFINSGMRRGIHDHELWAHVVSIYTSKKQFKAAMGITSEAAVQALVVDRSGKILERVTGDYSAEGAAKLMAAMK